MVYPSYVSFWELKDYRANTTDLDEAVHHEPPHQDLCCLQIQPFSSLMLSVKATSYLKCKETIACERNFWKRKITRTERTRVVMSLKSMLQGHFMQIFQVYKKL